MKSRVPEEADNQGTQTDEDDTDDQGQLPGNTVQSLAAKDDCCGREAELGKNIKDGEDGSSHVSDRVSRYDLVESQDSETRTQPLNEVESCFYIMECSLTIVRRPVCGPRLAMNPTVAAPIAENATMAATACLNCSVKYACASIPYRRTNSADPHCEIRESVPIGTVVRTVLTDHQRINTVIVCLFDLSSSGTRSIPRTSTPIAKIFCPSGS